MAPSSRRRGAGVRQPADQVGQERPQLDDRRAQEPVLARLGEQQQVLDEPAHALDLDRRRASRRGAPRPRRAGRQGEHLELAADDRQRRAQLVRGVGDERRLAVERVLEAVEHVVEGVGQHADLVVAGGDLHARAEVAARRRARRRAPCAAAAPRCARRPRSRPERGQRRRARRRAGTRRAPRAWRGPWAPVGSPTPSARDDAPVRCARSCTSSCDATAVGKLVEAVAGRRGQEARAPARFSCALLRPRSRRSSGGESPSSSGSLLTGAPADGHDEEHVAGRAGTAGGRDRRGRARRPPTGRGEPARHDLLERRHVRAQVLVRALGQLARGPGVDGGEGDPDADDHDRDDQQGDPGSQPAQAHQPSTQPVARRAHGLDRRRPVGERELAAQVADVDLDDVRARVVVVAPDAVEDLLARQHLAGVAHEVREQVELLRREVHRRPVAGHRAAQQVELDVRGAQSAWSRPAPACAGARARARAAPRPRTAWSCSPSRRRRGPRPCRPPRRAR